MDAILAILVALVVIGGVGDLVLHDLLLSRLRARHPDIWQALGPPTKVFDDFGFERYMAVQQFLGRPEYQRECDQELLKLARFIRIYYRVFRVVVMAFVAALVFYAFSPG